MWYDYDTFSELVGQQYFNKAFNIASLAPNGGPGYEERNVNNRLSLINQIINPQFLEMRKGVYRYHRHALDKFTQDPVAAQNIIIEVLEVIQAVRKLVPTSILLETFFFSKKRELAHIFSGAEENIKRKAALLLRQVDPTNASDYIKMTEKR